MKTKILLLIFIVMSMYCFGQNNTNTGTGAGNSGSNNTSIGYNAGDVVTGSDNTFLGYYAGKATTSGLWNAFIGSSSGQSNTSGSYNIFLGKSAGHSNTTGNGNFFTGHVAGFNNTTGSSNIFLGKNSGSNSTSGSSNIAIGNYALLTQTGSDNVIIGHGSGSTNSTSSSSFNVMIGNEAGKNPSVGSGNVFIGYQAGYSETGSNKLYIENSNSLSPLIYGDFATDKVGINSLPNTTHTLTVGGTIHSTGLYVNGVLVSGDLSLWNRNGNNVYTLSTSDNIGIGTTLSNNPNSYKLAVNGKIGAKEVQIENTSLTWPDFVFKADYKLMTLSQVEAFIKANGHLPEVPSEAEVAKEGIKVSELNAKLLQKIEELTLYVIELKKEVDELKHNKQ